MGRANDNHMTKTAKRRGIEAGAKAARMAAKTVTNVHMTARDIAAYTAAFVNSFRKVLKKKR